MEKGLKGLFSFFCIEKMVNFYIQEKIDRASTEKGCRRNEKSFHFADE